MNVQHGAVPYPLSNSRFMSNTTESSSHNYPYPVQSGSQPVSLTEIGHA
jgi:hypothetical protein